MTILSDSTRAASEAVEKAGNPRQAVLERIPRSATADDLAAKAHRAAARNDRTAAVELATAVARTESSAPRTLAQLLRSLGVHDKPVTTQWHALVAWLADNQVTPRLWMSMLANGYGVVIERTTPGFRRPIPYRRITTASGTKAEMLI
jgi:hypothetical protein